MKPKVTITLKEEDTEPGNILYNEYCYAGGLIEYVKWLNVDKACLMFGLFSVYTTSRSLQWSSDAYSDTVLGKKRQPKKWLKQSGLGELIKFLTKVLGEEPKKQIGAMAYVVCSAKRQHAFWTLLDIKCSVS
ncbi:unnamed protein product [Fraxinus pennsylvanica]|uniref:Uncharacterized protein n=1 Tax=Fraxinus pennsylvanica TaxID=56036 RepID=A0AAD2ADM5_9LAMI|nr:unnamed protein product [Fraxinus pennsylvanica]